jgi:hypothetical protein
MVGSAYRCGVHRVTVFTYPAAIGNEREGIDHGGFAFSEFSN